MKSYLRNLKMQIDETNVHNENLSNMVFIEGELKSDFKTTFKETSELV